MYIWGRFAFDTALFLQSFSPGKNNLHSLRRGVFIVPGSPVAISVLINCGFITVINGSAWLIIHTLFSWFYAALRCAEWVPFVCNVCTCWVCARSLMSGNGCPILVKPFNTAHCVTIVEQRIELYHHLEHVKVRSVVENTWTLCLNIKRAKICHCAWCCAMRTVRLMLKEALLPGERQIFIYATSFPHHLQHLQNIFWYILFLFNSFRFLLFP